MATPLSPEPARAALTFADLRIRYPGAATAAIDGVSFSVGHGTITAVTGPNGSGKSTLVRALLGRVPIAQGRILLDGQDISALRRRQVAQRVAIVPQREQPVFPLRVGEYIALGRFPHQGVWQRADAGDNAATERAIARAGVADLIDRSTEELSGGEWQRVRIARALAQGGGDDGEGGALVLDEPTTFLDVGHEMALFELLADLARGGMAVLLITHELNLVARFAATMVLLDHGAVAAVGPPTEVMRGPVLERVYDWPLVIGRDPAVGAPMLIPLRATIPVRGKND
jgi:iron complex transport system ATP-binding protein